MPEPPRGREEYDFCQMLMERPRITARAVAGGYELYAAHYSGRREPIVTLPSWVDVYTLGRKIAEEV